MRGPVRAVAVTCVVTAGVLGLSACGGADTQSPPGPGSVTTTTTAVGGFDLVTPERTFDRACGTASTPDPGQADVSRIAVADPSLLDPLCALGIQSKVVAVAADPGGIPTYLGPTVTSLPTIGSRPDAQRAAGARADVVLGRSTAQTAPYDARSVVVDESASWQDQFQAVADALGRGEEGTRRLDTFAAQAKRAGQRVDASHSQVGLVRFGADSEQIAGTASFAGSILAAMGVQRPQSQRSPGSVTVTEKNFDDADADLVYVSFTSAKGKDHGVSVLRSDRWLDLGAASGRRVFVVDDSIWYGRRGLAAAPVVLDDVQRSLNGYSG
ncbi:ABC transporter substrate-binding protein [uncultured Williamsia sp.]|uniref:ABC transporter substrate-binding protein n=1 Tax=uncultured Williamsia sp. TaxID=259311 RepID=UPI002606C75B|nr:ABC transporter substrate-binding protein [uncultured Williamsia sp.]